MSVRIAINGYGRIGRNVLRALYESKRTGEIEIVAISDEPLVSVDFNHEPASSTYDATLT